MRWVGSRPLIALKGCPHRSQNNGITLFQHVKRSSAWHFWANARGKD
jgi:hypothetical protein